MSASIIESSMKPALPGTEQLDEPSIAEDERYAAFIGKEVVVPILGRVSIKVVNGNKEIEADKGDRKVKIKEDAAGKIKMEVTDKNDQGKLNTEKYEADNADDLLKNADMALYRAKEHARGSYQFYTTDMNATAFERLVLETQLRRAVERRELVVQLSGAR